MTVKLNQFQSNIKSGRSEVPLVKGVLEIRSKFTGEHPCRSAITLQHEYSPVNLLHIFRTPFLRSTSGWLLLQHQGTT